MKNMTTRTVNQTSGRILRIKIAISVIAVVLVIGRLVWPSLNIDAVTLGLIALGVLPWLSPLIKSAELPGGMKIEFQDIKNAVDKVTADASVAKGPATDFAFVSVAERDPNLALVGLRIEIEKRLRSLAERNQLTPGAPLPRLSEQLSEIGVLSSTSASGLRELVTMGNQAAHGVSVQPDAADWAITYGPRVLSVLDQKLGNE